MLVDVINNEIKKNGSFNSSIDPNQKVKAVKVSEIEEKESNLYKEALSKKENNKSYTFFRNFLYLILFGLVAYLGTPGNSNGARYEGSSGKITHK